MLQTFRREVLIPWLAHLPMNWRILLLAANYVDDIDGMVDVTDGIPAAADGKALSPIRHLGERLVVLEHFFDDFDGNINWEEDDEDNGNGTVTPSDSPCDQFSDGHSLADEEEEYRRQLSQPPLFTISHYE